MFNSSLKFLYCLQCGGNFDLETFEQNMEVEEGLLTCSNCKHVHVIINKIPFMVQDLSKYFSARTKLAGELLISVKSKKLLEIIKVSLQKIAKTTDDSSQIEKNWVKIYAESNTSYIQEKIIEFLETTKNLDLAIEHGCSIGKSCQILANHAKQVFGIDKSFYALVEAKKLGLQNCEFVLADSLYPPFGHTKFDIVLGLNVLELIEPEDFLKILEGQTRGYIILSDPYDYERGTKSVKNRLDENLLRQRLVDLGFVLYRTTKSPNFVPWVLVVNNRLELHYKVDFIFANRMCYNS